jgi:CarD family transcriptional regulator
MRKALSPEEVPVILDLLKNGRMPLPKQWAARHRKTSEILADGNPYRIAQMAGQLRAWELERGLADLDRQALRRAIYLLAEEVSQTLEISVQEAKRLFEEAWGEELN